MNDWQTCVGSGQPIKTRVSIHRGNSQLSRFGDISSPAYQDTKKQVNKNGTAVTVGFKRWISADMRFRPNVQSIFPALSVSSPAINIK